MKLIWFILLGLLLSLCLHAQKTIIVAFDVTKSMQCPEAVEKRQFALNRNNRYYRPELIWEPALVDLKSIVDNASIDDDIIILPFQDDDESKGRLFPELRYPKGTVNWQSINTKIRMNGVKPGNTCLLSVWNRAEKHMVGDFEFYFITDGDEDHGNTSIEKEHTCSVKEKIQEFKNKYKGKGRAYYSLLTYNALNSEIHEELNNTDYFKMKVPGTWDTDGLSIHWKELPISRELIFTPIGSSKGKDVAISDVHIAYEDSFFHVDNPKFVRNSLTFDIKVNEMMDASIPWRKINGEEFYEFDVKFHTPWNEESKYFIYDKKLTIRIIRPTAEKVQVLDTIKWKFDDEKLVDSFSKEIAVISQDGTPLNIDNLEVCNVDPNIFVSLDSNQIKGGKAIFSIDTTKLKNIPYNYDGTYNFKFSVKSNGKSVYHVQPFCVDCEILCLNTKSISFTTKNLEKGTIKYYNKFAWEDAYSDSIRYNIAYELSKFVSKNKDKYHDIKLCFNVKGPVKVDNNNVLPIQKGNSEVKFSLNPKSEELYDKIFPLFKNEYQVSVEIYNLKGIDKVFWNNKSYDVVDDKCIIEDAVVLKVAERWNPLLMDLIWILYVFFIVVLFYIIWRMFIHPKFPHMIGLQFMVMPQYKGVDSILVYQRSQWTNVFLFDDYREQCIKLLVLKEKNIININKGVWGDVIYINTQFKLFDVIKKIELKPKWHHFLLSKWFEFKVYFSDGRSVTMDLSKMNQYEDIITIDVDNKSYTLQVKSISSELIVY